MEGGRSGLGLSSVLAKDLDLVLETDVRLLHFKELVQAMSELSLQFVGDSGNLRRRLSLHGLLDILHRLLDDRYLGLLELLLASFEVSLAVFDLSGFLS